VTARLAPTSAAVHVRDLRTRLPFPYGIVALTHFPPLLAMESAT
jgi:hypothetical protein